jgi:hypothetical protein
LWSKISIVHNTFLYLSRSTGPIDPENWEKRDWTDVQHIKFMRRLNLSSSDLFREKIKWKDRLSGWKQIKLVWLCKNVYYLRVILTCFEIYNSICEILKHSIYFKVIHLRQTYLIVTFVHKVIHTNLFYIIIQN